MHACSSCRLFFPGPMASRSTLASGPNLMNEEKSPSSLIPWRPASAMSQECEHERHSSPPVRLHAGLYTQVRPSQHLAIGHPALQLETVPTAAMPGTPQQLPCSTARTPASPGLRPGLRRRQRRQVQPPRAVVPQHRARGRAPCHHWPVHQGQAAHRGRGPSRVGARACSRVGDRARASVLGHLWQRQPRQGNEARVHPRAARVMRTVRAPARCLRLASAAVSRPGRTVPMRRRRTSGARNWGGGAAGGCIRGRISSRGAPGRPGLLGRARVRAGRARGRAGGPWRQQWRQSLRRAAFCQDASSLLCVTPHGQL
jgi:hypothetical protein